MLYVQIIYIHVLIHACTSIHPLNENRPSRNRVIFNPLQERGVGVGEQLLKVSLEPLTGLGGGLQGGGETAVEVVAGGAGVAGTVTLTTGLDPDEGVEPVITGVSGRSGTETGALGVAPVAPLELAGGLLAGTALVGDELDTGPSGLDQERTESVDELLLVVDGVRGGVRGRRAERPGVVVGDVGDETTERLGGAGILVDLGVQRSSQGLVGRPSEPSSVAGIEVHGDVGQVEVLDGVVGALEVSGLSVLALGDVQVGDQVGQGVGLCKEC